MAGTARREGDLRNYVLVTAAYWADTLADGASRILVLFFFYQLGYSALEVATLFLFYEFFGIVTNLVGGMDCLPARIEGDAFLRADHPDRRARDARFRARRVAGRSVRDGLPGALRHRQGPDQDELEECGQARRPRGLRIISFKWVAILTGSKNALKGVGFFLGGLLLTPDRVPGLDAGIARDRRHRPDYHRVDDAGQSWLCGHGAKFRHMFSNTREINVLAAARLFLFASRDVWFVVALPVYLRTVLDWSFWQAGGFPAIWVIGYGIVQASAPECSPGEARDGSHLRPAGPRRNLPSFAAFLRRSLRRLPRI